MGIILTFREAVDVLSSHQHFRRRAGQGSVGFSIDDQVDQVSLFRGVRNFVTSQGEKCIRAAVETLRAGLHQLSCGQMVDLVGPGQLRFPASCQLHAIVMADSGEAG